METLVQARGFIFDLDGTLADSLADVAGAMNTTLSEWKLPTHSLQRYRQMIGEGVRQLISLALPETHQHRIDDFLNSYRTHYRDRLTLETRLYDGVSELIATLHQMGLPLAVLSNKRHDFTCALVDALFPKNPFVLVLGERSGVPRKPDPSAALEIAAHLRVPTSHFIFVGDSGVDMQTARAAGMLPVGVAWGFRPREELRQAGAHAIIESPAELLQVITNVDQHR